MSYNPYHQNSSTQRKYNQQPVFPPRSAGQITKVPQYQQARLHSLGRNDYGKNISDQEDQLADVVDSSDQQGGISSFKYNQIKSSSKRKLQQDAEDRNISHEQNNQQSYHRDNVSNNFFSPSQQGQNNTDPRESGLRKNIEFTSGKKIRTNNDIVDEVKYNSGVTDEQHQQQYYEEGYFVQQQSQPNPTSRPESTLTRQVYPVQQKQQQLHQYPHHHHHHQQQNSDTVNIDFSSPGDNRYTYNKNTNDHIRELYGNKVAQSRSNKTSQQLTNPAFSRASQRSGQRSSGIEHISTENAITSAKLQSKRYSRSPQIPSQSRFNSKIHNQPISKSMINSPQKKRTVMKSQPNDILSSKLYAECNQEQDPVYTRLYQHSKHLEERKHIKKITQNIYDETSQMKEVKHKPTVNDNSEKFAKRKQMYRLGTEPIQNALYRDFIYREKRKQDELDQVHAQLNADINRQKTNSKSYKLALKKLEKDLQDVFRDCNLDPTGQLSYEDLSTIISKIGVFKVHGNPQTLKKLQQRTKTLAQSFGPQESLLPFNSQKISGSMNNILMIANACNKKAAGNAIVQTLQRRERERELHLQLWRYLNPMNLDKIQSLVSMEFFKVILCQFTQNVKELASTVNELMNIAKNENKANQDNFNIENQEHQDEDPFSNNDQQDLSAIPVYHPMNENSQSNQYHQGSGAQDFQESPPPIHSHLQQQHHLEQQIAQLSYQPQTQDPNYPKHARNPSDSHFTRVPNSSNNRQQQISSTSMAAQKKVGQHSSPIASPQEIDQSPQSPNEHQQMQQFQEQKHSHRVAQLSGIPEETILSNPGGSGLGS